MRARTPGYPLDVRHGASRRDALARTTDPRRRQ